MSELQSSPAREEGEAAAQMPLPSPPKLNFSYATSSSSTGSSSSSGLKSAQPSLKSDRDAQRHRGAAATDASAPVPSAMQRTNHANSNGPPSQAAPAQASTTSNLATPSADVQIIGDLKSELFHASRQLTQLRQHARVSEETAMELRQRCHGLEMEKHTLTLALHESQERLRLRQIRADEGRRDAADAALKVVSLTAERDELARTVQEAWDEVAALRAAAHQQQTAMQKLQEDFRAARHASQLSNEQQSSLTTQLQRAQDQLQAREKDRQHVDTAHRRFTVSLQEAVQRLASLLSDVAFDYQQSVRDDSIGNRITAAALDAPTDGTREEVKIREEGQRSHPNNQEFPPHVVISPTPLSLFAVATTTGRTGSETSIPPPPPQPQLRAEVLLHDAENAVLQDLWRTAGNAPSQAGTPISSTRPKQPAPETSDTAATPPSHSSPPPPSSLRQRDLIHLSSTHPAPSSSTPPLSDVAALSITLAPLLLAMKQVAAMLGSVRHDRQRWQAEAVHVHEMYRETQTQLEALQAKLQADEVNSEASHGQAVALRQRVEHAEAALKLCRRDDARQRASLAHILACKEDWALIQHSVERLLMRCEELQKDLAQLRAHRQRQEEAAGLIRTREEREGEVVQNEAASSRFIQGNRHQDEGTRHGQLAQEYAVLKEAMLRQRNSKDSNSHPAPATPPSSKQDTSHNAEDAVDHLRGTDFPAPSSPPTLPAATAATAVADDIHSFPEPLCSHRSARADTPPSVPLQNSKEDAAVQAPHNDASVRSDTKANQLATQATHSHLQVSPSSSASSSSSRSLRYTHRPTTQQQQPVRVEHPVSRRYPAPTPEATTPAAASACHSSHTLSPSSNNTFSAAERTLLASLQREAPSPSSAWRHDTPSSRSPAPLHGSPSHLRYLDSTITGGDESSLFALEVLQVIEALDRRVAGALQRGPRV